MDSAKVMPAGMGPDAEIVRVRVVDASPAVFRAVKEKIVEDMTAEGLLKAP